ncbi:hypothetical protein SISSUDRAFT_1066069 [Sistotremastrum suecicum HHB10207 ss-3]|uniref:F-box domain-containing protein n=1 Tax=Sistotremastrum suecicum HHB10207 ss-3 TaxID=1314776 RepID=A0A165YRB9_9AGAM|nr:hypothetical protein SISSUDRAFT_1066069 [Sistotremastrum suecicum HHB10207 ss-3]
MEAKTTLLNLPPEITSIILRDATLADLVNLTQTCYQFYHKGKTSREFWTQATDIDSMALPTGHTIKTIQVDRLSSLAARFVSVSLALNVDGAKTKSALHYAHGVGVTNVENVDVHTLPGDSWYIERGMDRASIKRARPGWTHVSCDLGQGTISSKIDTAVLGGGYVMLHMASKDHQNLSNWIFRALTVAFPDEREQPAAPVIKHEQRVVLSHPIHQATFRNPFLLICAVRSFANREESLRLLNVKTKCGVLLRIPGLNFPAPLPTLTEASLSKDGRKVVVVTRDVDQETQNMIQIVNVADLPFNLSDLDVAESQDFDIKPSDVEWTEGELKITHSYIIPQWSQDNIPKLPSSLSKGALHLYSFRFPQRFSRHPVHFGSVYLCDDNLLTFVTHEALRETHILDATDSQLSRCMPIRWRKPGDLLAISVLDTRTKKLADYRLEVPDAIFDIDEYEVFGLDPSRGRLWMRLK